MTALVSRPGFRYLAAATALKLFSLTPQTRRLYRAVGNRWGKARHARATPIDVERGRWVLQMLRTFAPGALEGTSPLLELGTGWTHFYGLFLRLFGDAPMVLFDVQDNRNLDAARGRFEGLGVLLAGDGGTLDPRVAERFGRIAAAPTFDQLYADLALTYVIEPQGSLDEFAEGTFAAAFSVDVLEHVDRAALPATARAMYRVLAPGGIAIHQIGFDDHLTHYAPGMSTKEYLRFSDSAWRHWFENSIQYFNRVQRPELAAMFADAGFELLVERQDEDPEALRDVVPDARYGGIEREALRGTRGYLVARKGGAR